MQFQVRFFTDERDDIDDSCTTQVTRSLLLEMFNHAFVGLTGSTSISRIGSWDTQGLWHLSGRWGLQREVSLFPLHFHHGYVGLREGTAHDSYWNLGSMASHGLPVVKVSYNL